MPKCIGGPYNGCEIPLKPYCSACGKLVVVGEPAGGRVGLCECPTPLGHGSITGISAWPSYDSGFNILDDVLGKRFRALEERIEKLEHGR